MTSNNLFWTVPFLCFLVGYFITRSLFHYPEIQAPSVVGKQLNEACMLLSHHQLNIRLLNHKEDPDLPDGTVLSQIPAAGQRVKVHQTVFLSLSKQPIIPLAPLLQGKQEEEIEQIAHAQKIRLKKYFLESGYPHGFCIAQIPPQGDPMPDATMIVYLSKEQNIPVIWPNFVGKSLDQVMEFLTHHDITPHVQHSPFSHETLGNNIIIDQRPLAGSIISLDANHMPIVQLVV
jgi:beta-lactam-binding protein with PASTA domain